ncbi:MAG: hypothetical protein ACOCT0_01285 [Halobacteriota archaeon]
MNLARASAVALVLVLASTGVAALPSDPVEHHERPGEFTPPDRADEMRSPALWAYSEVERGLDPGDVAGYRMTPPPEVDGWNADEHARFDDGGETASHHPPGAELSDGETIHDAYVAVFTVTPSTVVHESSDEESLYVPRDGRVLAVVDYSVDSDVDSHSVETEVVSAQSDSVGGNTPSVDYERLASGNLTVRSTVTAERDGGEEETLVVDDTLDVRPYDLSSAPPTMLTANFPDGDQGVFVHHKGPWARLVFADGASVQSSYRFYASRNPLWDEMESTSGDASPVHPLQVHAYPSSEGTFAYSPNGSSPTVERTVGRSLSAPEPPGDPAVDVVEGEYNSTDGVSLRLQEGLSAVEMQGVLAGSSEEPRRQPDVKDVLESDLEMSLVERRPDSVVVEVRLLDETGRPIDTRREDESLVVSGREVETGGDGRATVETSRPEGVIWARYEPRDWRQASRPREADTATLSVEADATSPETVDAFLGFAALIAPFLLLVYMLDSMLGLGVWPPWRRL